MPSLSRVIAAHTQATPSSPPPEPQEILDQLIDSISSSDSQTTLHLVKQLDSSYINLRHSTLQLSPLEALFSRYPQLAESDLKILDSMFERGAALEMVDEKILKTMMELENDSQDSTEVVREFEAKLIQKFGELDQAKEVVSGDAQEADRAESSPLTSLPDSTPTPNRSPHPQSRSRSSPPLPRTNHSVSSPRSFPLSQPSPSFSPETSRSLSQTKPPSYPPGPRPLPPPPPLPANLPSEAISAKSQPELVRLFLPIPYDTTLDTVYYYFEHHLGVRISNVTLQCSLTPSRALIDVEKSIFDSGELRRRIDVAEGRGRMFPNQAGSPWRLNPREFDHKLSKNRWNEHRNGVQENAQYRNFGSAAISAQQDRFLGSQGGPSTERPIEFILSGFSPQTEPSAITTIIADVTGAPIEFSCRQEGEDELIVKFCVDEEEIAERIESELGKFAFEGRMITARRASSSLRHALRPIELEEDVPKIKQEESIGEGELEFARIVEQRGEDERGSRMARSHPSPRNEEEEQVATRVRAQEEEIPDRRRRRRRSSSPDRRARSRSRSYSRSPSPVKKRRIREDDRGRRSREERSRRYDSDEEEENYSRRGRRNRQDRYRSRSPAPSRRSHHYHSPSPSPSPPRRSHHRSRSPSFDRHRRRSRRYRSPSPILRHRSPSPSPPRHSSRRIYHHSRNTTRRDSALDSSHVSRRLGKRESTADGSDFRRSTSRHKIYHSDVPYRSFPRSRSPSTVSYRFEYLDELKPAQRNAYVESDSFYHDSLYSSRDRSNSPVITKLGEGRDLEKWYAWED